jgi:hypothetical protein
MKNIYISMVISCVMLVSGFWHQALASNEGGKINPGQLFESKCSVCHSIDRPKSKNKTKEEWKTTVMRMKNSNSCPITDEEAKMIIDYLAEEYGK